EWRGPVFALCGVVLLCGNGGSATNAQHIATQLLIRLRPHLNRDPLPALALALDSSSMTACAQAYSLELYFERMTRAFGMPGDVLLGMTEWREGGWVVAGVSGWCGMLVWCC